MPATTAAAAPGVLHVALNGRGIPAGTQLRDGHRTFDVPFRTPVFATATITDAATAAPLAGVPIRLSGNGTALQPTNAGGTAVLRLTSLETGSYTFDVPSLTGTAAQRVRLRVAPSWKVAPAFPVRRGKLVVSARLLALRSAREDGSYVKLQVRSGRHWVTVKRLPISRTLLVSARLPRSAYADRRMRFVYVSRTDYIGSSRVFVARAERPDADDGAGGGTTNFGGPGLGGAGNGGLVGGGDGSCAGC